MSQVLPDAVTPTNDYGRVLARNWYWVVLGALLGALIAGFAARLVPPTYTATSSVLLFIRQTGVQDSQNALTIETIDAGARRLGLIALAESGSIELRLPADVIASVAPQSYAPGALATRIAVQSTGDLINISAQSDSPERAKLLADAWAATFVGTIDELYTDQHSSAELASNAILPAAPSGPDAGLLIGMGSVVGAMLGIGAALLRALLTIRGFTVLGTRLRGRGTKSLRPAK